MKLKFASIQRKTIYSPKFKETMKIDFAGVKRKNVYSPNHVNNDAMILSKTANVLRLLGHEVKIYDESYIEKNEIEEKFIFSMAQGLSGIMNLRNMERNGAFILNKPASALNTYRIAMTQLLMEADIPFPNSVVVSSSNKVGDNLPFPSLKKIWLKRGDVHAEHKEDVTLIYSKDELDSTLEEFCNRGIGNAVIQEHLPGDTIKFYGIRGSGFLYWYYLNGTNHVPFNQDNFKRIAFSSAEVLDLDVFGGDVIISPKGEISVIDVNDWPSFAPVRDEAAEYIGQLIHKKALDYVKQN